ncbi:MAG: ADP-ribosylglycohydrolase family protein [Clostridia bacterium]|nr:ADP-ribosylglycohydrolase family protein [Clostridia bacterium]
MIYIKEDTRMKTTSLWLRLLAVAVCAALLLGTLLLSGCSQPEEPEQPDDPGQSNTPETPDDGKQPGDGTIAPVTGKTLTLTDEQLYDKIAGSWVGQMIGVTWSASTEFRYNGVIIPEGEVPVWRPEMVNDAFGQDDLYVEVPFIDAMKDHGPAATIDQIAPYFRDSKFGLAHANYQGRLNLQMGIEPSLAGHYKYNYHADDIDWQIEADFLGNIYPGMVSTAGAKAFEIGHLMNYGDGVYGGVFVSAMHAMAMVSNDLDEVIDAGISIIPEGTEFRAVCDQVMDCYADDMTWQECWQAIEEDWAADDKCPEFQGVQNIDAKINAAYILIGLLWGEGDLADTIVISMRCGQDSDCNPSSAAAILGTMYGLSGLPEEYKSGTDFDGAKFAYTEYTLNDCIQLNYDLAKQAMSAAGYPCESDTWTLTKEEGVTPVPFEQWPDDELVVYMTVVPRTTGDVSIQATCVPPAGYTASEVSYSFDMGDGTLLPSMISGYTYTASGTYTIKCTASVGDFTATASATVEVTAKPSAGFKVTASCSETVPAGGGSRNISVITDGETPTPEMADNLKQYDTYGGSAPAEDWYALNFDHVVTVSEVLFTEGAHFGNGGWFKKTPRIEALIDGKWTAVDVTCSPLYIEVDDMAPQGDPYQTFTFKLEEETACEGVRVIGVPGGSSQFVSCAELAVNYTHVENPTYDVTGETAEFDSIVIVSESNPAGAGCKDINIIRDGEKPSVGSSGNHGSVQYDTFVGSGVEHEEFFGYIFRHDWEVFSVEFTEGAHFDNGGWFKDGTLRLELLLDGEWVEADCSIKPSYPDGDSQSAFGSNYQTYTFTLEISEICRGVRVIGMAGGSAHFTSISELAVDAELAE